MTKRYLLLIPQRGVDFHMTNKELIKAMKDNFGCDHILSKDTHGNTVVYAVAPTIEHLERLTTEIELEGQVVEMTGIFDMIID
jgi:hypothetical protein